MKLTALAATAALLLPLAGCSSLGYQDAAATETVAIEFGTGDLLTLAGEMTDSLLASPALNRYDHADQRADDRVVMVMGGVENRTTEHIDTSGIQDEMRARMLESGRFRIVAADQGQGEIADQVRFQQGTGIVDPTTAKAFGSQVGADMIIYGTLRSIEKERDRSIASGGMKTELLDYQFALTASDISTGEQLWAKTEYIRKVEKRGLFGR